MTFKHISIVLGLVASSNTTSYALSPIGITSVAEADTLQLLDNVVVTGSRSATTARNLPMTISVVGQQILSEHQRINVLPTLT